MNARAGNSTALRRLMTEYKQLTSGGTIYHHLGLLTPSVLSHSFCIGSPDGMFTAGT
jgi:hypothetical protein